MKKVFIKDEKYPTGLIGIAESGGEESDLIEKAKLAINNPLLQADSNQVKRCLVSVSGDHTLPLAKVDKIVSTISNEIPADANLKFGVQNNPALGSKIKIMVLANGPVSPYVRAAVDSGIEAPPQNIFGF